MNKETSKDKLSSLGSQQSELLEIILNTTQTKIFWKDAQRRFVGANKAFLDYYGFPSLATILGKTDEDMGWHDDPNPFKNDEIKVLQKGISISRVHGKCTVHGEERDILASKSPVYRDGQIIGLVGSFDDVTEEYRQRDEISRLNQTLNSIPAGIAVFKPWRDNYLCISANDYFAELVGATKEKFVGKSVRELLTYMHPEDGIRCVKDAQVFANGSNIMIGTYRYINHTTGEYLWLFTEGHLVTLADGEKRIYFNYTNVSSLKQAQEAEESMRRQYESSIEAAKLFLWVYDIRQHTIYMEHNPYTVQCCQNMGLPMVVTDVPDALLVYADEDSRERMRQLYKDIETGVLFGGCDVAYHLPGRVLPKYIHITLTNIFDEDGHPVKAYGVSRDVTEEKEAQQQYEHEVAYIHADDNKNFIAKAHNDLTANQMLEYIRISENAARLDSQISYDDGCKIFEQLPALPDDRESYAQLFNRQALLKAYREGKHNFSFECRRNQDIHAVTWVNTDVRLCLNPASQHIESFMYSYDVTDKHLRQQLMTNLRDLGYKHLGMINIASNSATYYGMDPNFDRWQVWMETDDYSTSTVQIIRNTVPQDEQEAVIEETKLSTIVENLQATGEYSCSYNRMKGNQLRRILVQYRYLDKTKKDIFLCVTDNTEGYQQEQKQIAKLRQAMLDVGKANDAKSTFLASISHDMRTPLNGILGFTDLALNTEDQLKRKEYLTKIAASGQLMLNLVNDVLDLSKIESGKLDLNKEVFAVKDFLDSLMASVQQSAIDKDITLTSDIQTGNFVYIREDKTRLQQIMLNIISNAVKYTLRGGHVHIVVKNHPTDQQGHNTLFTVTDDGIGMSREFLAHVFEPFSQEHAKEAEGVESTGLGMSIVKRIINLMGGGIEVQSSKGKGTTFTVSLAVENVEGGAADRSTTEELDYAALQGKRILVCEDNKMNVEILQVLLKSQGMLVETADNGQLAVEKFAQSQTGYYDAIIMDIRMPVMDGLEATKAIRALDKVDAQAVPIIANSADVFKEEVERFLAAGMNNYVPKPIDKKRLYETLCEELEKRQK